MSPNLKLNKGNRLRKITRDMFGWKKTAVCDGVFVYEKSSEKKEPAILIAIPKSVIKSAVKRNNTRRKVREIFRKNISRDVGISFVVKFKGPPGKFTKELENYFKNV